MDQITRLKEIVDKSGVIRVQIAGEDDDNMDPVPFSFTGTRSVVFVFLQSSINKSFIQW